MKNPSLSTPPRPLTAGEACPARLSPLASHIPTLYTGHGSQLTRLPAQSFEHVLANMNKLNRGLEGVIAVGNEFSSVEALWSQFEAVTGKEVDAQAREDGGDRGEEEAEEEGDQENSEEEEVTEVQGRR